MNILFLSTRSPYPLISGHSLRTYNILRNAAYNHNIVLISFAQLEDEFKDINLDHLKGFCDEVFTYRIPVDMSRIRLATSLFINLFSPLPFVVKKYDVSAMREKIREIIRQKQIDLVHVDMLPLTVYIEQFKDFPKLIINHNVESVRLYRWYKTENNLFKKIYLGLQWLKLLKYEKTSINRFDCCVAVSEIDAQLLKKMGIDRKIVIVPNGTDTEYFKPIGKKKIDNSVMWFGHMDVHTNKDAVLYFWQEIYPILRKHHPEVHIIFVGTAPPRVIENAAKNDNLVKVTGFVDDIRPYVDMANVIVVPIRIGSGTRLKILDAMAMGKAIVSTSIGCEGLNVSNGENILIADDPDAFAGKVIKLLKDPEKTSKLEKNARQLAMSYNWEVIAKKQDFAYEEAIKINRQKIGL